MKKFWGIGEISDAGYYTKEDMVSYYGFLYDSGMAHFAEDINPENKEEMDRLWEINGKADEVESAVRSFIEGME
jgi:hypothetical protein